jgi:hypothetical protein
LRVLLAVILMLNGIASAMAAVQHAARPGAQAATSEMAQVDSAAGSVHDGCAEMDPGLAAKDAPFTGSTHGADHSPGPDCCEPGVCQGACATAGVPAIPPNVNNEFGTPGQTCPRPTASWHAGPALPHLMRPPIT